MEANPSPETLADGAVNTPADGGGTVEESAVKLTELNKFLGADFKDVPTALKALKDTKDFVGKRKEDIAAEVTASLQQTTPNMSQVESDIQALKNQLFYSQNPQYKGLEPVINSMGANPSEVVGTDAFKTVYEKVKVADEIAQNKSVVQSNSRLSQPQTSVIDQMVVTANARGSTLGDVAEIAAQAINREARGE